MKPWRNVDVFIHQVQVRCAQFKAHHFALVPTRRNAMETCEAGREAVKKAHHIDTTSFNKGAATVTTA